MVFNKNEQFHNFSNLFFSFKRTQVGDKLQLWKKFCLFVGNSFNFKIKKEPTFYNFPVAYNIAQKCVKS